MVKNIFKILRRLTFTQYIARKGFLQLSFCLILFANFSKYAFAYQCSLTPLEPIIWSEAFDIYNPDYGGTILDLVTDGTNLFMCTAEGHTYCTTF